MFAAITLKVRLSPPRSHGAFHYKALECHHRLGEIAPDPVERKKGPSLHCRNTTLHSEFNSDESVCRSAYPHCVKETVCKGLDWVDVAQDTVHWWAFVSTKRELWILLKIDNSDDRLKFKVKGKAQPRTGLEGPEMKYTIPLHFL